MAKQNKTICLELDTIEKAKKQAEELGMSFSAYIEYLLIQSPRMLQFITDIHSALTDKGELTIFETSQKLECENILKEILD